jgi:hypothetical protein
MARSQEDIDFIKAHMAEWLTEQSLGKPPAVYDIARHAPAARSTVSWSEVGGCRRSWALDIMNSPTPTTDKGPPRRMCCSVLQRPGFGRLG